VTGLDDREALELVPATGPPSDAPA
jgi:hypothetical protein